MKLEDVNWSELLEYDPSTGLLRWKPRKPSDFSTPQKWAMWTKQFCHKVAGSRASTKGRKQAVTIRYKEKLYMAHRIIWTMTYGVIQDGYVPDHRDGDPWNNRLTNLRMATHQQNLYNSKRSTRNMSGIKGIAWHKRAKKWVARIRFNGKEKHLGLYHTKGLAAVAHAKAAIRYHGEFARVV